MDPRHKKILQRNRTNLVGDLDPSNVYDGLLTRGVFTQDMIDEIKSSGTRRDQARQLMRDLETRGSRAFSAFLECLRECGYESLVSVLQTEDPVGQSVPSPRTPVITPLPVCPIDVRKPDKIHSSPPKEVPLYPTEVDIASPSPERESPKPRQGRTRRDSIQSYKMDASPCGLCLIINNVEFEQYSDLKDRKGSDIDSDKLKRRFKSLNFDVVVKRNLKHKQMKQELSALSKTDHSNYDCCVIIMLSHGTEATHSRFPGAVYGVDGVPLPVQDITNYLNGHKCPSLQGKPKLFFLQACGGGEKDTGFEVSPDEVEPCRGGADDQTDAIPVSSSSDSLSMSDEVDARATLPASSDILVSYSTFPGFVSWRDTKAGSWYVETLDRILEQNAATDDLVTILMMVNDEVSQNSAKGLYKQMPGSFNFLRKHLHFQAPSHSKST
ncbi:caspase-9 isoform X2 [Sardina pilchardus]